MIHSMSGGVIREYETLTYAFAEILSGAEAGVKKWYISPFITVKVGDTVEVPTKDISATAKILRVEKVTAQTAPFPVSRTGEILRVLP